MNPQLNVGATRTVYSDERYFAGIDRHPSAHDPDAKQEGLNELLEFVQQHKPVVLTGAGVSTPSGIPDYRGPAGLRRDTSPIRYQELAQDMEARRRYWARSFAAWPSMAAAQPNIIHHKLAHWLDDGFIADIVTQNVDRLHHRAGAFNTIELHGTLYLVRCLDCGELSNRDYFQERLRVLNEGFEPCTRDSAPQPDGDMNVSQDRVDEFNLVTCLECSGTRMKPDVVFFGENVPRPVRARVDSALDEADSLLVLGTSLAVMSSLRLVRKMVKDGKPVFVVTSGVTRADELPIQRLDCLVEEALEYVTRALPDRELPGMDDLEPEPADVQVVALSPAAPDSDSQTVEAPGSMEDAGSCENEHEMVAGDAGQVPDASERDADSSHADSTSPDSSDADSRDADSADAGVHAVECEQDCSEEAHVSAEEACETSAQGHVGDVAALAEPPAAETLVESLEEPDCAPPVEQFSEPSDEILDGALGSDADLATTGYKVPAQAEPESAHPAPVESRTGDADFHESTEYDEAAAECEDHRQPEEAAAHSG